MSSIPPHFNYAEYFGIELFAPSIVFTVLYVPLLAFFARKSRTHPTYVHYTLTFFCTIRVTAFAIRVALTGSTAAGEILGLVITDEILFAVGYFSLLYSAYTLVLDRILLSDLPPPKNSLLKISQNRRLFRIILLLGLILVIVASSNTSTTDASITANKALRITGTAIFLLLTIVQAFQTIILARSDMSGQSQYYARGKDSIGIRYGNFILLMISLLLLIREGFAIATVDSTKQDNEHFWYPFTVITEFLVVLLYTTPGLVPRRDELPSYSSAGKS